LHYQNEKKIIKPSNNSMIDWGKFAIRWKYYSQKENCHGNSNFLIQDQFQLKQNKENEDKEENKKCSRYYMHSC